MDEMVTSGEARTNQVECVKCGAMLAFQPGTAHLTCEYCGAENEIEVDTSAVDEATAEIGLFAFLRNMEKAASTEELATVSCTVCGATVTFDEHQVATECSFCGSPMVAEQKKTARLSPKSLLPFGVEVAQGRQLFAQWLKGLWFAPNKLKRSAAADKLTGIYIPYWTYDAQTATDYQGERGDDYTTTERYTENGETKTRTVTKTRWTTVMGDVDRFFDDVLVAASKSLPEKYVDALEPWDLENLVPYDSRFLLGFKAETYQMDLADGFEKATSKMETQIRRDIERDIGGDHQRIRSVQTEHSAVTFKHILLPIWLSAYQFKKKTYRFMINGRTGEVQGERPYSWVKISAAALAAVGVIGAIAYLFING